MPSETAQSICSILMGNILVMFPRLRFCFAHGGGAYPIISGRVSHGYKIWIRPTVTYYVLTSRTCQVRPDLCATDCSVSPQELQRQIWTDSLVHDPLALHLLLKTVGKDKVVLGTDYPFPLGELEVGKVVEEFNASTDIDKDKLLWKNAVDMLRLNENALYNESF
ncbi:unnamed protein product [Strongylus vulgaris]|uniref:2-amino-3-carboxymuconate-6-semialdehyde decarboxylase n=1 Tax=Strongylus vulgaris TaxID=40348 RepID=A0A3P7I6Z2_STRVU|nr:unnamed protein product [Strongylus vulgaris]